MFKLFVLLPFIISFAGSTVSAPIVTEALALRKFQHKGQGVATAAPAAGGQTAGTSAAGAQTSAAAGATPCTNTDQSAAAFGGDGEDPDVDLPRCEDVATPFPCTNIQAVANAFGTALCSTVDTAAAPAASPATAPLTASPTAAVVSPTAAPPAVASTGAAPSAVTSAEPAGSTECTNTDQSAAAFSGNDPDEVLPRCEDVTSPFECTNIQAIVKAFGTAPCSALLAAQQFPATLKGTTQCTPFATLPVSFNGPDPDADLPQASFWCADVASPAPCTNLVAVKDAFGTPSAREPSEPKGLSSTPGHRTSQDIQLLNSRGIRLVAVAVPAVIDSSNTPCQQALGSIPGRVILPAGTRLVAVAAPAVVESSNPGNPVRFRGESQVTGIRAKIFSQNLCMRST
ncbi:hypothetical protein DFH06DRAFT_1131413 [Mycena polygramma]|nr:hypothetical protein DFH06DRAFT_1131413 [Mycena polygramma]